MFSPCSERRRRGSRSCASLRPGSGGASGAWSPVLRGLCRATPGETQMRIKESGVKGSAGTGSRSPGGQGEPCSRPHSPPGLRDLHTGQDDTPLVPGLCSQDESGSRAPWNPGRERRMPQQGALGATRRAAGMCFLT